MEMMPNSLRFERLARQHKDAVYRQMVRVCGDRDDAEDVLIEALLRAYRSIDTIRDDENFRGWLAIVARRLCGRVRRKEALLPLIALSDLPELSDVDPSEMSAKSIRAQIEDALDTLSPLLREVYELRDLQQLSGDEVVRKLGISEGTMKSRLHRARAQLRKALDHCVECHAVSSNFALLLLKHENQRRAT
jgi:RNA polymerase sigma-70 factor (ECF subfamily)